MFLGAMIMGPLTALIMKRLDAIWSHKIRPGFEMLVNNFSAGILAAVMAIAGMFTLAPVLLKVTEWLGNAVNTLVDNNLLPLTSIFIEPAKVLFLNNAINHGVLTPLGIQEAAKEGQSVLFLLEANPGPGLGLLLAYTFFGRGLAKASAPGAAIIQFFGGIHEIYFPYVLMKPKMILATIAGGMTGVFLLVLFDVGLRAPAAPGSIFAVYAQTPSGDFVGITVGVFGAALVSFLVGSVLLKMDRSEDDDLVNATAAMEDMKGKKSVASSALAGSGARTQVAEIHDIVFACDAGMGSSAMGASVLRRKIHEAGFGDVTVVNKAISNLTDELRHRGDPPGPHRPGQAEDRVGDPRLRRQLHGQSALRRDRRARAGRQRWRLPGPRSAEPEPEASGELLARQSVVLRGFASTQDEAITEAGELLVDVGAVDPSYIASMHEREESVSTHMGNGLAIPHGTNDAKSAIRRSAISFVRYPSGIDWNGHQVKFVVGIAGAGDDHLALLSNLGKVFVDRDKVAQLEAAETVDEVRRIIG